MCPFLAVRFWVSWEPPAFQAGSPHSLPTPRSAKTRKRSCILLWMAGGPTQTDTFDLKRGHANGGPFKEIDTTLSGIRISEHLPKVAKQMKHLALIRSMKTKEGDHGRAIHHLRTATCCKAQSSFRPLDHSLPRNGIMPMPICLLLSASHRAASRRPACLLGFSAHALLR